MVDNVRLLSCVDINICMSYICLKVSVEHVHATNWTDIKCSQLYMWDSYLIIQLTEMSSICSPQVYDKPFISF